jgi:hypothetical protein
VATFFRLRARHLQGSQVSLLTYYWDSTGGTPAAVATEAGLRVRAFWVSFASHIPNTSTVTIDGFGDEVNEANGSIVGTFTGPAVASVNGTGGGDGLPRQTQGLLRYGTGGIVAGRRITGRQFIPSPSETDNTGGLPTALYTADLNTAANLLGTTIVTPISQRVWHRPGAGAGLSFPVTSRSAGSGWAVLRSRRS